jgi:1,4-dihydroxy-2-naphthoate octaprenyltransferase
MNTLSLTKALIRPKTLIASISPVLISSAWALKYSFFSFPKFCLLLSTALMLQILSNVANDYFDGMKGTDTKDRIGPARLTASGQVCPKTVRNYLIGVFTLTLVLGLWLSTIGGPLVAFMFALAALSAILYTAGPFALSYNGLAEPFAFLFFGPIPAFFASYVFSGSFHLAPLLLGFLPGIYSLILITINNLRDHDSDKACNKNTLIVKKGKEFGKKMILGALLLQIIVTLLIALTQPKFSLSLIAIFEVFVFYKSVKSSQTPQEFLPLLKEAAKLYLLNSILWTSCFMI